MNLGWRRFTRCESGNVMFMTAGALLPMLGLVAGGIELADYNRTLNSMQHAADTAVMSAFDLPELSWGKRIQRANGFFTTNFKHSTSVGKVTRKLSGRQRRNRVVLKYTASAEMIGFFGELNPLTEQKITVTSTAEYFVNSNGFPRLIPSD